ncbi:hypothetical protein UFOVP636_32 [uncultured Caudovirales phage]|uniref:Uncharacterized protein n=1 Tax=uncultured Caudovirales phage TaxID=2100421 RepID=A0A6J5N746_9CAUD|nr:hypothetical protein UFOVP636_32 [uncultured Caudovirales phage]
MMEDENEFVAKHFAEEIWCMSETYDRESRPAIFDTMLKALQTSTYFKNSNYQFFQTMKFDNSKVYWNWCNEANWNEQTIRNQFKEESEINQQQKTNNKSIMEKTSKVLSAQSNGSFESNYGTLYGFEVAFENGDVGNYNSKSSDQNKFVSGQEATYTIETKPTKNGKTFTAIKPVFSPQQNNPRPMSQNNSTPASSYGAKSPETEARIIRMNALTSSVNFLKERNCDLKQILEVAETFISFINAEITSEKLNNKNDGDLPF